VYLLAAQLLFSGGFRSTIPAFSGYLVGYMYNEDYCSIQRFRFPRMIEVKEWYLLFLKKKNIPF
jgi:hypothetical protein